MNIAKKWLEFNGVFEVANFFPNRALEEIQLISEGLSPSASEAGIRGDVHSRCHLKKENAPMLTKYVSDELPVHLETLFARAGFVRQSKSFSDELMGSSLRVELVNDGPCFWQIPHFDVSDKLVTIVCYLKNDDQNFYSLGTTLFQADTEAVLGRAKFEPNRALIFFPKYEQVLHGFERRDPPSFSSRRCCLINYVVNWRDSHELLS